MFQVVVEVCVGTVAKLVTVIIPFRLFVALTNLFRPQSSGLLDALGAVGPLE